MVIWCLKWQMKTPDSTKRLTISLFVDQDERHWLYHYEFSLRKSILLVVRKILLTLFWYIYISFLDVGVDIDIQGKNNYNQVFLGLYARKIWHVWWMSSRIMGVVFVDGRGEDWTYCGRVCVCFDHSCNVILFFYLVIRLSHLCDMDFCIPFAPPSSVYFCSENSVIDADPFIRLGKMACSW